MYLSIKVLNCGISYTSCWSKYSHVTLREKIKLKTINFKLGNQGKRILAWLDKVLKNNFVNQVYNNQVYNNLEYTSTVHLCQTFSLCKRFWFNIYRFTYILFSFFLQYDIYVNMINICQYYLFLTNLLKYKNT